MKSVFILCLGLWCAAGWAASKTGVDKAAVEDPAEKEFRQLVVESYAAQHEGERLREQQSLTEDEAQAQNLKRKIDERYAKTKTAFAAFLAKYPDHGPAEAAYGRFLAETFDEKGARVHLEKALALGEKSANTYNDLANLCGHNGDVKKAFEYYAKAIELDPQDSNIAYNFGTTLYVFRHDAMEFYHLGEQQLYDKSLALMQKSIQLNPRNYKFATEVAQTYYGIKPLRTEEALRTWTNVLAIASDEEERENAHLHLARVKILAGRLAEAQKHLNLVTNEACSEMKARVVRSLGKQQTKSSGAPKGQ